MNEEKKVLTVDINDILPNRFQPRLSFDDKSLNELALSIKEHGIIQPLIVRRIADKYEIIAGERRYKAASMIGLREIPVILTDVSDNKSAEMAIVENIQRRDMSPLEEAKSFEKLMINERITQEDLAIKMGKSQSQIANKIRLLSLGEKSQEALLEGKISERHARSLLKIKEETLQDEILEEIINQKLNVKKAEDLIDSKTSVDKITEEVLDSFESGSIYNIPPKPLMDDSFETRFLRPNENQEVLNDRSLIENNTNIETEIIEDLAKIEEENQQNNLEKPVEVFKSEELFSIEEEYNYAIYLERIKDQIYKEKLNGGKIAFEELDFEKEYQIIVKIEK